MRTPGAALAAMFALSNALAAEPVATETLLARPGEPIYESVLSEYPALRGASVIGVRNGQPHQAHFDRIDEFGLQALVQSLFQHVTDDERAALIPDPPLAGDDSVIVRWREVVDGMEVLGADVLVERGADGSGSYASTLVPVARERAGRLSPERALREAQARFERGEPSAVPVGKPTSVESAPVYVAYDGRARLAYRARFDAPAVPGTVYLDVASGKMLGVRRGMANFDAIPSDVNWTLPPWVWEGVNPQTGQPITCPLDYTTAPPTPYYPQAAYLLRPAWPQLNVTGPALRLRDPDLGLTIASWALPWWDFANNDSWQNWAAVEKRIVGMPSYNECAGSFPAPLGVGDLMPYRAEYVWQERQLRTAILELQERFTGWGVDRRKPLVVVPDIEHYPGETCSAINDQITRPFDMIVCPRDEKAIKQGKVERHPPMEIFAHEVAHFAIAKSYGMSSHFDNFVLGEGLADLLAVYVDSRHDASPWRLGDRPAFMQRIKEWRCKWHSEGCNVPAPAAMRDLSSPKTMNPLDPGPIFWEGQHWGPYHLYEEKKSQVIGHMMYLMAEGASAGARDDNLALGTYEAFAGIGFEPMIEILRHIYKGIGSIMVSSAPGREFARQVRLSAAEQCGLWSREELLATRVAWITNLGSEVVTDAGYLEPSTQEALPWPSLRFQGQAGTTYQLQLSRDAQFTDIAHDSIMDVDGQGVGRLDIDLDGGTEYWWRVRRAKAPMLFSPWIASGKDRLCWRPAESFITATVESLSPADGDVVEPWTVQFEWTGNVQWTGYELWVDDKEPQAPRYANRWAHKLLGKELQPDPENPGTPSKPNYRLPPIPLPSSRELCWKLVPYAVDDDGQRRDGDGEERCFTTGVAKTLVKSPLPDAEVFAQPLEIAYDPADGAASHDFSLEVLTLAGGNAPAAQGPWAYKDDVASDPVNHVIEDASVSNWTHRTRLRMLPVQLEATPFINYEPAKVRLTVKSRSPTISGKQHEGTYEPRVEETAKVTVDFHPAEPTDFLELHPFVTAPLARDRCSSSVNSDLMVRWRHGAAANEDTVPEYRLDLYESRCNNLHPVGCFTKLDPLDPNFGESLALSKRVSNNGSDVQEVEFERSELFPDTAHEENSTTGFLVHLQGISGPSPGPAGLNLTGSFLVDLPVLPAPRPDAKDGLHPILSFFDAGPGSPHSRFTGAVETRKNPAAELARQDQYVYPRNHIVIDLFKGPGCQADALLASNRHSPKDNSAFVSLGDPAISDEAAPVVSMRAEMTYGDMSCPTLVSECVSKSGVNHDSKPHPVEGLAAMELGGHLGVIWNAPADPDPASLRYHVRLQPAGDLSQNFLVSHPAQQQFAFDELQAADGKVGRLQVASLDPADAGKQLSIKVKVCRAVSYKCSDFVTLPYEIGGGDPTALPLAPVSVTVHPDDDGLAEDWTWLDGTIPNYRAVTVSWEPPATGPAPTYYLIGFSSLGTVPGVLPTWINALGVPGAEYPDAAEQYTTVVRATGDGMVFGFSTWGSYVMPLAITQPAEPPASGTWVTANVWSCVGQVPLPPLKSFGWITGASLDSCTGPAAHSAATP